MRKNIIAIGILFFVFLSAIPIPVSSFGQPIGIGGYITTKDGLPVDNASVQIRNTATGEHVYTTTNILGMYGRAITGDTGQRITVLAQDSNLEGNKNIYVNLSNPTQWANITIEEQQGGGTQEVPPVENPPLPEPDSPPEIPPPQPPLYRGASVYEMYDLLKITSLPNSKNKVTVMVIDSGAISDTVNAFLDPDRNKTVNMSKIDLRFTSKYFKDGIDANGHGSFTNYEVAYILQMKCVNAIQISYRVFGADSVSTAEILLDALKQAETIKPDVVSISIGAPGKTTDSFAKEVTKLRDMGIIVVVAAGNYGWNKYLQKTAPSTITSPGLSDGAICVGAFDYRQTKTFADDIICKWSSRGPVAGVPPPKPDVVAPGESITGIKLATGSWTSSGTSFACPLIAGGTAVVIANTKELSDQVKTLYFWDLGTVPKAYEQALRESCIAKGDENDWGAGIPQYDKVLTIFTNKLNYLIIQFVGIVVIAIVLAVGSVLYVLKRKASPWWKKTKTR